MVYDALLKDYRVRFEGFSEPIFYKYFYSTGNYNSDSMWEMFRYLRGLKKDKESDDEHFENFSNYIDEHKHGTSSLYEKDLRDLFRVVAEANQGSGKKVGVVVIPSSNTQKTNRVTELVRSLLYRTNYFFADLTNVVVRVLDKDSAHDGGDRSIGANLKTLGIGESIDIDFFGTIIVLDDILTSGNSFRAMDHFLRRNGFKGEIVNFAYARTFTSRVTLTYLEYAPMAWFEHFRSARVANRTSHIGDLSELDNKPIIGVIYDLDQTLIDDKERDEVFEANLWRKGRPFPYKLYDGIPELMKLPVQAAVVSNRPEKDLNALFEYSEVKDNITFHEWVNPSFLPLYSFPTTFEQSANGNTYKQNYYKPFPGSMDPPGGVIYALSKLYGFLDVDDGRVIGVGNTLEDMIAYKAAGIEAILALWGVPDWLKAHAKNNWGAHYVFKNPHELKEWLDKRIDRPDYLQLARDSEHLNRRRAIEYYEKALEEKQQLRDAAFRYAFFIDEENPEKAKELYQIAINEGDEYAATNNLANLLWDEDEEYAKELYERAIEAGSSVAMRNLAISIQDVDPERAVELYKMGAEAGNDEHFESDLQKLVDKGVDSAIDLYVEKFLENDSQKIFELGANLEKEFPEKAAILYEKAVYAGDKLNAAYHFARLMHGKDKELAREFYEMAIETGDEKNATNGLALLISDEEPEQAKELFNRAIAAGDEFYAPRNLARRIKNEDPEQAVKMFAQSAKAGNADTLWDDLTDLVRNGNVSALNLCEEELLAKNGKLGTNLGHVVYDFDRDLANKYYRIAFDAGDKIDAPRYLALSICESDPIQAIKLYRESIAAGGVEACWNLAELIENNDPKQAQKLFHQYLNRCHFDEFDTSKIVTSETSNAFNIHAILTAKDDVAEARAMFIRGIQDLYDDEGDDFLLQCNLAHLELPFEPENTRRIYETLLDRKDPEAFFALSFLKRDEDAGGAIELLEKARSFEGWYEGLRFFLNFLALADRKTAIEAGHFLGDNGITAATRNALRLQIGSAYDELKDVVLFGKRPGKREKLKWDVIKIKKNRALILARESVAKLPYTSGSEEANWMHSEVRAWLNEEFLNEAFSDEDRERIWHSKKTNDKVFILSQKHIKKLRKDDATEILLKVNSDEVASGGWWLKEDKNETISAPYINENGEVAWAPSFLSRSVRPAIWITFE